MTEKCNFWKYLTYNIWLDCEIKTVISCQIINSYLDFPVKITPHAQSAIFGPASLPIRFDSGVALKPSPSVYSELKSTGPK